MLIQTTRSLTQHQKKLEDQRRKLQHEQTYANDLRKLREKRQQKSYKQVEILEDHQEDLE